MKRWIGSIALVVLVAYFAPGLGAVPVLVNTAVGRPAINLKVSPALPQVGGAPVGLPSGTPHSSQLSWTAGPPVSGVTVAGYNVYRSTTPGGEAGTSAINGNAPVSGTSYTDSNVTAGAHYFYVVAAQAANTGNQSGFSNEANDTIPANPSNPSGCNSSGQ